MGAVFLKVTRASGHSQPCGGGGVGGGRGLWLPPWGGPVAGECGLEGGLDTVVTPFVKFTWPPAVCPALNAPVRTATLPFTPTSLRKYGSEVPVPCSVTLNFRFPVP